MSKYRRIIPNHIDTESQAMGVFNTDSAIFLFGDNHYSQKGHRAVADLMPDLFKANVTALALELPPEMNSFLGGLQARIRNEKLGAAAVKKLIDKENDRLGLRVEVGGEQRVMDWAKIIVAATENGIAVAGIDSRATDTNFADRVRAVARMSRRNPGNTAKIVSSIADVAVSEDKKIAGNARTLLAAQGPGKKIAIMFGIAHSCNEERQKRLINYLNDSGVKATAMMLDPLDPDITKACNSPPTIQIDARKLHRDIKHNRPKQHATSPAN